METNPTHSRNTMIIIAIVALLAAILASVVVSAATAAIVANRNNSNLTGRVTQLESANAQLRSQIANQARSNSNNQSSNQGNTPSSPNNSQRNVNPPTQVPSTRVPQRRSTGTPQAPSNSGNVATQGALIQSVETGSAAAKAGLRQGDIIIQVDDTKIDPDHNLADVIQQYQPGDQVTISYTRNGSDRTAQVTLGKSPTNDTQAFLGVRVLSAQFATPQP